MPGLRLEIEHRSKAETSLGTILIVCITVTKINAFRQCSQSKVIHSKVLTPVLQLGMTVFGAAGANGGVGGGGDYTRRKN